MKNGAIVLKKTFYALLFLMLIFAVKPAEAKRLEVIETGIESVRWRGLLSVSPGRAFFEMYQANYEYSSYGASIGTGIEYIYHGKYKMHGAGIYFNVYPLGTALDELFIGAIAGYNLMETIFLEHNDEHGLWYSEESFSGFFYGAYAGWRFVMGNFIIDLSAGVRGMSHRYEISYDYSLHSSDMVISFWPSVNIGFIF
jgi:hypothetical protein